MKAPPLDDLTLDSEDSLKDALKRINATAQGIAFIVDKDRHLVGILTDGDIRRLLIAGTELDARLADVMKTDFLSRPGDTKRDDLISLVIKGYKHIPLVDQRGILKDYFCTAHSFEIPVASPCLSGNELAYISDCIKTNWISSGGAYVKRFEKMFAAYCAMPHALATSSGTTALHLALLSAGVGPGDEVIVPDLTFAATINCALYAGATPVIVDVEPRTWCMGPKELKAAITKNTKAVIPVHLYGQPCPMTEIMSIADEHKIFVIEDCAEALGSAIGSRKVGSFGHAAIFSFFGNKTITTGEGGMALFRDGGPFERATLLRDHGMKPAQRYWHDVLGYNYRMTNLQAALGVAQMERVDAIVRSKLRIGELYNSHFKSCPLAETPAIIDGTTNAYWLYSILLAPDCKTARDELARKLRLNAIESRPVFYPLHAMPLYESYAKAGAYPVASDLSRRGISLPSAVSLGEDEVKKVADTVVSLLAFQDIAHKCS